MSKIIGSDDWELGIGDGISTYEKTINKVCYHFRLTRSDVRLTVRAKESDLTCRGYHKSNETSSEESLLALFKNSLALYESLQSSGFMEPQNFIREFRDSFHTLRNKEHTLEIVSSSSIDLNEAKPLVLAASEVIHDFYNYYCRGIESGVPKDPMTAEEIHQKFGSFGIRYHR